MNEYLKRMINQGFLNTCKLPVCLAETKPLTEIVDEIDWQLYLWECRN